MRPYLSKLAELADWRDMDGHPAFPRLAFMLPVVVKLVTSDDPDARAAAARYAPLLVIGEIKGLKRKHGLPE